MRVLPKMLTSDSLLGFGLSLFDERVEGLVMDVDPLGLVLLHFSLNCMKVVFLILLDAGAVGTTRCITDYHGLEFLL